MRAVVKAIAYHLPEAILSNGTLAEQYPEWSVEKIEKKTGILHRHIAADDECASDLAVQAARKLFAERPGAVEAIDYLLLCTQSPDYLLPTTACLLQARLGLRNTIGALDINLGCSGFVYGLGLAKGLIESGQAERVLMITAETYTKFIHPADKSVRTIFGDGAAATLIEGEPVSAPDPVHGIGPFVFGTDGRGGPNLIVPAGGMRRKTATGHSSAVEDALEKYLYMNGGEIFKFSMQTVPGSVEKVLLKAGKRLDEIDLFVFHQANRYMLENLRKKIGIPEEKFVIDLHNCANTVSATIPIALKRAQVDGRLRPGMRVMVVGFGVGYSWAAALLRWAPGQ
ncbi:MAG: ketoacyl-ACP synthase III [Desulfobacteraceae bacterium]|nr:ketoacyl-ACP synthase III [Desulfobacteraceae bacterium]